MTSGVTRGGRGGRVALGWKVWRQFWKEKGNGEGRRVGKGKERQGKMENGEEKKGNCKSGGRTLIMERIKVRRYENEQRTIFFFSFFFSPFLLPVTFWNHRNLFGVYQNGNFYQEKKISHWENIKKCDFAPSEKYYAYVTLYRHLLWEKIF